MCGGTGEASKRATTVGSDLGDVYGLVWRDEKGALYDHVR